MKTCWLCVLSVRSEQDNRCNYIWYSKQALESRLCTGRIFGASLPSTILHLMRNTCFKANNPQTLAQHSDATEGAHILLYTINSTDYVWWRWLAATEIFPYNKFHTNWRSVGLDQEWRAGGIWCSILSRKQNISKEMKRGDCNTSHNGLPGNQHSPFITVLRRALSLQLSI